MDSTIGYKIDYIRQKYRTINGRPVEELPERQIGAIYYSMLNRKTRAEKPKPIETERQMTIWDVM